MSTCTTDIKRSDLYKQWCLCHTSSNKEGYYNARKFQLILVLKLWKCGSYQPPLPLHPFANDCETINFVHVWFTTIYTWHLSNYVLKCLLTLQLQHALAHNSLPPLYPFANEWETIYVQIYDFKTESCDPHCFPKAHCWLLQLHG